MGRSVSTPRDATSVAYDHVDREEGDDWLFDDLTDDAFYRIVSLFPSMSRDSGWAGREDMIVASNGHASFGYSEYCGLIAYWMIPKSPLGAAWIAQNEKRFDDEFASLRLDGFMSNGEAVFYRTG